MEVFLWNLTIDVFAGAANAVAVGVRGDLKANPAHRGLRADPENPADRARKALPDRRGRRARRVNRAGVTAGVSRWVSCWKTAEWNYSMVTFP
jgi:hypothetical protein